MVEQTDHATISASARAAYGMHPRAFYIKRSLDFIGALVAGILLSPALILIAITIKLFSGSPVLFKQTRVGYRGRKFTFYKFRTMKTNCDDRVHREYVRKFIEGMNGCNGDSKPLYKLDDDSRVTKIGKVLRRWSLDELPQLFNVLKGDMSLIGPRPPIPYEVEKYKPRHMQRLAAMPGITGLWQVNGRSRTTFDEMVELDIRYIRNWTLSLDLIISLKTIKAIWSREGAL